MNIKEELLGAIARGWCTDENSHKDMDSDLAVAIYEEVLPVFKQWALEIVGEDIEIKGEDDGSRYIDRVQTVNGTKLEIRKRIEKS